MKKIFRSILTASLIVSQLCSILFISTMIPLIPIVQASNPEFDPVPPDRASVYGDYAHLSDYYRRHVCEGWHYGSYPYRTSTVPPQVQLTPQGELIIKETDLSIPGRGLDLVVERMWCLPTYWQNDKPYGFEASTADLGKVWFLNFPWIGKLLHTWDGRCYEMKWSGNVFENHEYEHFRLVKESNGAYTLYYPSATILRFDSLGRLSKIEDNNGNNLVFAYGSWPVTDSSHYIGPLPDPAYSILNGYYLANITDTIGRVVHFLYSDNRMLMGLSYCGMTVDYVYKEGLLVGVKDVQGRYTNYEYYCAYGAWLPYKVKSSEGGFTTYKWARIASNYSDNALYRFKVSEESSYDSELHLVGQTAYRYIGNFSCTTSSSQVLTDEYGNVKTKVVYMLDSEGHVLSSTSLDMTKAQSTICSESLSTTKNGAKFGGGGYWNGKEFIAHYTFGSWTIDVNLPAGSHSFWEEGDVEVGPFTHYPGTSGYNYYTTSVNSNRDTITVTTFWTNCTIPQIEKTVYSYNSNSEVIKEDKYIGDTDTVSYSTYSRYDNWGNLVYSKDAMGQEAFYSYANTETSGVFVDNDGRAKALFSNLFYGNAVPSNIHSALIGSAKLQDNGTATESYSKYDSKGNLIESRNIFGQKTAFAQFSGTFNEPSATSFSIDLTGVNMQGDATLEISGQPKTNQIPKTESHSRIGCGFDFTGYWENHLHNCKKYFMAHFIFMGPDGVEEDYAEVGPFQHYPGTAGYTGYSVSGSRTNVTVTTKYNVPTSCYPARVSYHFNTQAWEAITQNLNSSVMVHSIPASELTAGINTLYFSESSGNSTKFAWKLYVPIYMPPKEDIRTQNTYDCYGNIVSSTDAEGLVTLFEYSSEYAHAYCTKTTVDPEGANITSSSTYYYHTGKVASATGADGFTTLYEYDNLGRSTRVIGPDGLQTRTEYDDINHTVTAYSALGVFSKAYYDGLGRTIKTEMYLPTGELYAVKTCTYNSQGKILQETVVHAPDEQNPPTYSYEYDIKGRVVKKVYPDGNFSICEYDDMNLILTTIGPNGRKTEQKSDLAGHLVWVKEYIDNSTFLLTQSDYDYSGHTVRSIDAVGRVTTVEYGSVFGATKTVFPDLTTSECAYNKVGKTTWVKNRNGDETHFVYDRLHRLVQTIFADGTVKTETYDSCSRLTESTYGNYSSTYYYGFMGRLVGESHRIEGRLDAYNVSYEYDVFGRLTNTTYPDGFQVCYEYDSLGRIVQVRSGGFVFGSFSYNVDGSLSTMTYGNGLQKTYTYDVMSRLVNVVTFDPYQNNASLLSLGYVYDAGGYMRQIINGRRTPAGEWLEETESYDYDRLGRLVFASGGFGAISYSYDASGNRLSMQENEETTTYQYDAYNRLLSYQSETANVTFTYDISGNMMTKTANNETWQYTYNRLGMLCQISDGEDTVSYSYDERGNRVYVSEENRTTVTIYSSTGPVYEEIVENGSYAVFDYVGCAVGTFAKKCGSDVLYHHNDHLGSTRLITNNSRAILCTMSYKPFGQKFESYGGGDRFGYNGKEESFGGLYYYGVRYYDPESGRFVQEDSAGGFNRYAYCGNNPVMRIDPTGHVMSTCQTYGGEVDLPEDDLEQLKEWIESLVEEALKAADEIVQGIYKGGKILDKFGTIEDALEYRKHSPGVSFSDFKPSRGHALNDFFEETHIGDLLTFLSYYEDMKDHFGDDNYAVWGATLACCFLDAGEDLLITTFGGRVVAFVIGSADIGCEATTGWSLSRFNEEAAIYGIEHPWMLDPFGPDVLPPRMNERLYQHYLDSTHWLEEVTRSGVVPTTGYPVAC